MALRMVLVTCRASLTQREVDAHHTHYLKKGVVVEHMLDEDHPHFDKRCFGPPCNAEGRVLTETELDQGFATTQVVEPVAPKTQGLPGMAEMATMARPQQVRAVTDKLDHSNDDHWTKLGKSSLDFINAHMPEGSDRVTREALGMYGLDISRDQASALLAQQSRAD